MYGSKLDVCFALCTNRNVGDLATNQVLQVLDVRECANRKIISGAAFGNIQIPTVYVFKDGLGNCQICA